MIYSMNQWFISKVVNDSEQQKLKVLTEEPLGLTWIISLCHKLLTYDLASEHLNILWLFWIFSTAKA